jgi:hypothetical protein
MNEQERKIKLLVSECVECKTHDESYIVRKQADALGLRWTDGLPYLSESKHSNALPAWLTLHDGRYSVLGPVTSLTVIPATQWLNRHGVFVPGQRVRVMRGETRLARYIGDCQCEYKTHGVVQCGLVTIRERKSILTGCDPDGNPWPEWREEPDHIALTLPCVIWCKGKTAHVTPGQAEKIRAQIDAQLPRKEQA